MFESDVFFRRTRIIKSLATIFASVGFFSCVSPNVHCQISVWSERFVAVWAFVGLETCGNKTLQNIEIYFIIKILPVWTLWCKAAWLLCLNVLGQYLQRYLRSPVCTTMWPFKDCLDRNDLEQISQIYLATASECFSSWASSLSADTNTQEHFEQWYLVSACTICNYWKEKIYILRVRSKKCWL